MHSQIVATTKPVRACSNHHGPGVRPHAPRADRTRRSHGRTETFVRQSAEGIAEQFSSFEAVRADGALLGSFNAWLHDADVGNGVWTLTQAVSAIGALPNEAKQVAILVTGARYKATFEIYAHVHVALEKRLASAKARDDRRRATSRGSHAERRHRYDVASALGAGGVLPRATYDRARDAFGRRGIAELVHLVGLYAMVCTTLNGFDVPVPEQQDGSDA